MSKKKRIFSRVCAIALALVIITLSVLTFSTRDTADALSLPAIEGIKASLKTRTFNILEIYDPAVGAQLLYLTDGALNNDYATAIAGTTSRAQRAAAIDALTNSFPAAVRNSAGTDLTVNPYEIATYVESYFWEKSAAERAALQTLALPAPETLDVRVAAVTDASDGNYLVTRKFSLADSPTSGLHIISGGNLRAFDGTSPAPEGYYYAVTADDFLQIDLMESTLPDPSLVAPAIYKRIEPATPGDPPVFEYRATWPNTQPIIDECTSGGTFDYDAFSTTYYCLPTINEVGGIIPEATPKAAPEPNEVIYVLEGTVTYPHLAGGYIKSEPTTHFTFVESGGDCNLTIDGTGTIDAQITTQKVWYSGGFKSHNWFSRFVFDTELDAIPQVINYNVVTYPVGSVPADIDFSRYDLVSATSGYTSAALDAAVADPDRPLPLIRFSSSAGTTLADNVLTLPPSMLLYSTSGGSDFKSALTYASASGFDAALDAIKYENFLRSVAGGTETPLPEVVSLATLVRHILNFGGERRATPLTQMRVLDIHPHKKTTDSDLANLTVAKILTWLPEYDDGTGKPTIPITITRTTMAEFNGKIEDLAENYELIYINGSNDGNPNGSAPVSSMLYYNIGEIITKSPYPFSAAGLLATDWTNAGRTTINLSSGTTANRFRRPPNDLSTKKLAALEDFVAAGYPVVAPNNIIAFDVSFVPLSPNTVTLDRNSRMYAFLNDCIARPNFLTERDLALPTGHDRLSSYITLSKPTIVSTEVPTPYTDISSFNAGGLSLRYTFTISDPTDATPSTTSYNVHLYIDADASGIYTKKEEVSFDVSSNGRLLSPTLNSEGERVFELKAGTEYTVGATLPEDKVGIVPWKLEVVKNTAGTSAFTSHGSQIGYTRVKPEAGEKETINVLQIVGEGLWGQANALSTKKVSLCLELNSTFKSLAATIEDFDVRFHSIAVNGEHVRTWAGNHSQLQTANPLLDPTDSSNILASYGTGAIHMWNNASTSEEIYEKLAKFDMIIVGFADCYEGVKDNLAQALLHAIEEGQAVLFTHDTTSFISIPSAVTNKSNVLSETGSGSGGKDTEWGYAFNRTLRGVVGLDSFGVYGQTEYTNPVYVPGSNGEPDPYIQGMTQYLINRSGLSDANQSTSAITQVNSGQLTTYPFNVNLAGFPQGSTATTMGVGSTHFQYFSLNLNYEDLVVWYALGNSGSTSRYAYNDASNGYYIYTMGNVTYSGVGHSAGISNDEAKLFLNTMIASFRSTKRNPIVTVRDRYGVDSSTLYFTGAPDGDIMLDENPYAEMYAAYFTFVDPVPGNHTVSCLYTIADGTEKTLFTTRVDQYDFALQRIVSTNVEYPESSHQLPNLYRIYVPSSVVSQLTANNTITITITVTAEDGQLAGSDSFKLRKITLLELR